MSDPVASSGLETAAQSASATEARARLAPLEDALLLLLAKRLAQALLLDGDDQIEPDPLNAASRPVESGEIDLHS